MSLSHVRSSSSIDALDAFILGVKWRFEVGLGLVRHAHPLQGKLARLDEIGAHLMKKGRQRFSEKKEQRRLRLKQKVRRPINPRSL